ncbi:hypothetical protein GOP47_0003539, partial [Adiantum capillus-veneris]
SEGTSGESAGVGRMLALLVLLLLRLVVHAAGFGGVDHKAEEKKHKQRQHAADACALAAGAFALHEKHEAKKHPEQRHAHKVREHVAATIAIGAGTLAVHEKHERKHTKEAAKKQQHGAHHSSINDWLSCPSRSTSS